MNDIHKLQDNKRSKPEPSPVREYAQGAGPVQTDPAGISGIPDRMTLLHRLDTFFSRKKRLVVVLHDYPDPDAIASAWALCYFAEQRYGIPSRAVYGGVIQRAENLALVKELHIRLFPIGRTGLRKDDCVAHVDTQPGSGNNSLPRPESGDLIFDHHPKTGKAESAVEVIDPAAGATATLLVELLQAADLSIPVDLATALTYAIRTETQELGRETSKRDIQAYLYVYALTSMKKLSKIAYPKLPHSYFQMLSVGLNRARIYRNLIAMNFGPVLHPEIVAELADMLLRRKHSSWVICTGRYENNLHISIRSSNPKARAGKLIRRIVRKKSDSGGHDTFAGGKINIARQSEEQIKQIEEKLVSDFAGKLGFPDPEWRMLIESQEKS